MFNYFSNNSFIHDYLEGWGADYYIHRIFDVELVDGDKVLEQDGNFFIPIYFTAEIEYVVEAINPNYEVGDREFFQSDAIYDEFLFECKIVFNAANNVVEEIIDVKILFQQ